MRQEEIYVKICVMEEVAVVGVEVSLAHLSMSGSIPSSGPVCVSSYMEEDGGSVIPFRNMGTTSSEEERDVWVFVNGCCCCCCGLW